MFDFPKWCLRVTSFAAAAWVIQRQSRIALRVEARVSLRFWLEQGLQIYNWVGLSVVRGRVIDSTGHIDEVN
jgi:hypothetical protein